MQNRPEVFLLLAFLHFGKKWPFFSWNALSALTQRETSHLCKSPSLPSGLRWPYWGGKVEGNPSERQGRLCFFPKAFLFVCFQNYFLFSHDVHFSPLSSVATGQWNKRLPKSTPPGDVGTGGFLHPSPRGPVGNTCPWQQPGTSASKPRGRPKAPLICPHLLWVSSLWPQGFSLLSSPKDRNAPFS